MIELEVILPLGDKKTFFSHPISTKFCLSLDPKMRLPLGSLLMGDPGKLNASWRQCVKSIRDNLVI